MTFKDMGNKSHHNEFFAAGEKLTLFHLLLLRDSCNAALFQQEKNA